jgi:hypothetical protein
MLNVNNNYKKTLQPRAPHIPREAHFAVYVLYVHKTEKMEAHMLKIKESSVGAIKNNNNKTQTASKT